MMNKILFMTLAAAMISGGCASIENAVHKGTAGIIDKSYLTQSHHRSFGNNADHAAGNSGSYFKKSSRMMAYEAGFTLTVKSRNKALDEIRKFAESMNGYLLSSARGNMVIKIPAGKADEFLKKSSGIGEVSDFRISAEDLTDTITDLGVRLDNLRKLRARLTELLDKAKNVDEMLKVERELNRITTDIERIDAQLQNNKKRVDYVTFSVAVIEEHGTVPSGNISALNSFSFLKNIANNEIGMEDDPLFSLAVPQGFVTVKNGTLLTEDCYSAVTCDDCFFRTWEVTIPDHSDLAFWGELFCRALTQLHNYDQVKHFPVLFNGKKALKITAQLAAAKGTILYMAIIAAEENFLCSNQLKIVEFYGPESAFKKHESSVSAVLLK